VTINILIIQVREQFRTFCLIPRFNIVILRSLLLNHCSGEMECAWHSFDGYILKY